MDEIVDRPARTRRATRWLARVGVIVGCVVALGAGYAAAAGGLPSLTVFNSGLTGGGSAGYRPYGMAAGSDSALWFSAVGTNADSVLGRVGTDGTITTFTAGLPTGSDPYMMAPGPDGNVWFTDVGQTRAYGKITPDGTISELPAAPHVELYGLAAGPDGNMWFTGQGTVSKLTAGGQTTVYNVGPPSAGALGGIAAGPDGAMWFALRGPAAIGRITMDGAVVLYSLGLSSNSTPTDIVEGPDGNMWFLDAGHGAIGRITTGGAITEFSLGHSSNLFGIATGTDGNIWFTDVIGNMLGRITPDGTITEFDTSSYGFAYLFAIKTGSDGNIWLTGLQPSGVPVIVRVDLDAPAASVAPPQVVGSKRQGEPQSCHGAVWSNWAGQQPSTSALGFDGYQWLLDGNPIAGQTAQSYIPTAGDIGHQLSCKVIATYTLFPATVSATSAAVTVTAAPAGSSGGGGGSDGGSSLTPPVTTTTTATPPPPPPVRSPAGGTATHATTATLTAVGVQTVVLHAKPPKLHITLTVSQTCNAVLVLRDAKGKTVATWKVRLARGTDKLALVLPLKARRQGRDTLRLQVGTGKAKTIPVTIRA